MQKLILQETQESYQAALHDALLLGDVVILEKMDNRWPLLCQWPNMMLFKRGV